MPQVKAPLNEKQLNRLKELSILVQQGENVEAVTCAGNLIDDSISIGEIIEAVSEGVAVLRNKCTVENFQLLDVLLASRAMVEVVDECVARKLKDDMDAMADDFEKTNGGRKKKILVIGTIQGDVHDLGKHIMATLSRFNNLRVVNLGKDIPPDTFVEAAIRENADFVGVSSLMTVCLPKLKQIKPALVRRGRGDIKVVGGGSAVHQSSAEALELDYLAFDAFDGLDFFSKPI